VNWWCGTIRPGVISTDETIDRDGLDTSPTNNETGTSVDKDPRCALSVSVPVLLGGHGSIRTLEDIYSRESRLYCDLRAAKRVGISRGSSSMDQMDVCGDGDGSFNVPIRRAQDALKFRIKYGARKSSAFSVEGLATRPDQRLWVNSDGIHEKTGELGIFRPLRGLFPRLDSPSTWAAPCQAVGHRS
jgi:hypothetical protein